MDARELLGYGLVTPLRRVGADFAAGEGLELVRSAVGFILGTRRGEIPWRPSLGTTLDTLRHHLLDEGIREMAVVELNTALQGWDTRIVVTDVEANAQDTQLRLRVTWAPRAEDPTTVDARDFTVDV